MIIPKVAAPPNVGCCCEGELEPNAAKPEVV